MKIILSAINNTNSSQKKFNCYYEFLEMFDLKELKLMFLDPTDLIINNINNYLCSNKTIKSIFS